MEPFDILLIGIGIVLMSALLDTYKVNIYYATAALGLFMSIFATGLIVGKVNKI